VLEKKIWPGACIRQIVDLRGASRISKCAKTTLHASQVMFHEE